MMTSLGTALPSKQEKN